MFDFIKKLLRSNKLSMEGKRWSDLNAFTASALGLLFLFATIPISVMSTWHIIPPHYSKSMVVDLMESRDVENDLALQVVEQKEVPERPVTQLL